MEQSLCPVCDAPLPESGALDVWLRCSACEGLAFRSQGGRPVVVTHDSEEMCQQIGIVLSSEGLRPLIARSGGETLYMLRRHNSRALVLDAGLSKLPAFALISQIRGCEDLESTTIVLLASVYNRTAYKRRPTSLYGADDYVEQHHIPDLLPSKLGTLLGVQLRGVTEDLRDRLARIKAAEQRRELRGAPRVRALARAIVGDIALYHEDLIQRARREGISPRLLRILGEGRRVLAELAHGEAYPSPDPVGEAFEVFVEEMESEPV